MSAYNKTRLKEELLHTNLTDVTIYDGGNRLNI